MITIISMKNSVTNQILGANIRKLREAKEWTQAELSRRTGIDTKSISRYENGQSFPSAELIDRIAIAFGVKVSVLFEEDDREDYRKVEVTAENIGRLSADILEKHSTSYFRDVVNDIQELFEQMESTVKDN